METKVKNNCRAGALFVVSTPIGNLEDISNRALRILSEVNIIAAEDTRHTRKLLTHFNISGPSLFPLYDAKEDYQSKSLLKKLMNGYSVALVSDAGTPLISDPGYRLVKAAHEHNIKVLSLPGPSSVTAALSICGLPTDRFTFEGFLPSRRLARQNYLKVLQAETRTMVFFESPKRIKDCLMDMVSVFGGDRDLAVCREITKKFETVSRGKCSEISDIFNSKIDNWKGEIVIVISGLERERERNTINEDDLILMLAKSLPPRKASEILAKVTGGQKNDFYKRILGLS